MIFTKKTDVVLILIRLGIEIKLVANERDNKLFTDNRCHISSQKNPITIPH